MNRRSFLSLLGSATVMVAVNPRMLVADTSQGSVAIAPAASVPPFTTVLQYLLDQWKLMFGAYPAQQSADYCILEGIAWVVEDNNARVEAISRSCMLGGAA